jgi:osmotically-inducible protein OsmY
MHNFKKLAAFSMLALMLGVSSSVLATESTGQYIDDAAITAKVKAALLADKELKSTQVSVDTTQGTVHLKGSVDTKNQESQAVRDANQVAGVKSVDDLLQINSAKEQQSQ